MKNQVYFVESLVPITLDTGHKVIKSFRVEHRFYSTGERLKVCQSFKHLPSKMQETILSLRPGGQFDILTADGGILAFTRLSRISEFLYVHARNLFHLWVYVDPLPSPPLLKKMRK